MVFLVVLVVAVVVVVLVMRAASAPGGPGGGLRAPRTTRLPRGQRPTRPMAPDDDPEFLRELERRRTRRDEGPAASSLPTRSCTAGEDNPTCRASSA